MVPPSEFESLSTPWKVYSLVFTGFNRFINFNKFSSKSVITWLYTLINLTDLTYLTKFRNNCRNNYTRYLA